MYSLPKDSDRFDPRKHASVLLNINEKQQTTTPGLAGGSTSRRVHFVSNVCKHAPDGPGAAPNAGRPKNSL
ncbi:hypothetical protein HaLaN_18039, partial [Haematococcus lacustris]